MREVTCFCGVLAAHVDLSRTPDAGAVRSGRHGCDGPTVRAEGRETAVQRGALEPWAIPARRVGVGLERGVGKIGKTREHGGAELPDRLPHAASPAKFSNGIT